jgi:hypothetical protein
MHSTLNPKQDDPHDVLVVAPDVVPVAQADEDSSRVAHDAMRRPWDRQTRTGPELSAGPSIPPVDTFRAAAVHEVQAPGGRSSMGGRAIRAFIGLLLAVCISVPAIAWQSYGDAVKQIIARWAPQLVVTSSPPENPNPSEQPAPPAVQATAANPTLPQPAATAQTAPQGVAPTAAASSESTQLLQSMASDLATARQEIAQLRGSVEQLKANQEQMSRDVAKASEQKARLRIAALPPRPAAAPARKPIRPFSPSQAAAAAALTLPQYAAPYVPRQPEPPPQVTAQPQVEPELSSIPRPPMPVR